MTVLVAFDERRWSRLATLNLRRQGWTVIEAIKEKCAEVALAAKPGLILVDILDLEERARLEAVAGGAKILEIGREAL